MGMGRGPKRLGVAGRLVFSAAKQEAGDSVNGEAGLVAGSFSSRKGEAEDWHGEGFGAQGGAAPASE